MTTLAVDGGNIARSLENVIGYIRKNASADLTLGTLARVVGVTPHHFSLLFTKATGLSPNQFVLQERIEQSKLYLLEEALSVKDVSRLAGFRTQEHFTKVFRRLVGDTPSQFRQRRFEERYGE
jgi:AraC-like DNA-binding protein